MNKPIYLISQYNHKTTISEILIYEFWFDYVKPKYGEKSKLCHIDADSFIVYI